MTEQTHAEKAQEWIESAFETRFQEDLAGADLCAQLAIAEAQLAVAEQQKRIADWLENWPLAHDESPVVSVNHD